jgi:alcohol dehydrogenase class IV
MNPIQLIQPRSVVFGPDVLNKLPEDKGWNDVHRLLFLVAKPVLEAMQETLSVFRSRGKTVEVVVYEHSGEPTFTLLDTFLAYSEAFRPDAVLRVGGGSVLDCAKLLAALTGTGLQVASVVGTDLLKGRSLRLVCLPTTAGTGSEVSPNAILLNEETGDKLGIISPYLVPDSCYVDPVLTCSLPPALTAETGMDALCHCIEAYTNKWAHPLVDMYALKGIELIYGHLLRACQDGMDLEARSALALGSLLGGLCLGPVNTTAVHASSYGLGGQFHIPHGQANALLMPAVLNFNSPFLGGRIPKLAAAMGIEEQATVEETAQACVEAIRTLSQQCGIPQHLSELGLSR